MSIYINKDTRVLVQGITGKQGSFHTNQMLAYGTKIVGGISPGKGGQTVEGVPVYDTVFAAVEKEPADAAILFIPAPFAKDAAFEALDAGVKVIVLIPEHIPVHDAMDIMAYAGQKGAVVVGPNTFGLVSSGASKIGIMPNQYFIPGPVGIVSRSGTLCYEIVGHMTESGIGTTTVVGLGGDRVVGLHFTDVLEEFEKDEATKAVILVGEIGGSSEEEAAAYIASSMSKPVIAYLAGRSAPPGKRMGHAGAIIERGRGTFESKVKALTAAGVKVADLPMDVPPLIKNFL
ncbi:MAG: succinate--CoA ligase subunit alpha [Dethiobacteria bacterium]|nr:succinate--CoA ligase subunit alpha [Dethiobacteria bacterium]